ncbi:MULTISPECIES: hypothetical protein [Nocardiopsis]|uniref:hypothetical protein n=1 Tax=Nocardiopsis TaxID=2013 RepID=UPI0014794AD4|nr:MULTISPECIES: hypothetical protein [Nocardiopsis]
MLVDCGDPPGGMWAIDPNTMTEDDPGTMLLPRELTFTEWMRRWTDGTLRRP